MTNLLILQIFATGALTMFAYYFGVDHGRKNEANKPATDYAARETAETALSAIARLRFDMAEMREHTLRDRDEMRDELSKQGRAIVNGQQNLKDAVDTCMREATKITMSMGQPGQRRA